MKATYTFAVLALFAALPVTAARAQGGKTVTKEGQITATSTIQAIDATARTVTLRNEKGEEDTFSVGPEVRRFNELKVGDKIRATYYESLVFQLRKPGAPSNPTADALAAGRAKATAPPGGAIATQQTRTVTVKAVDASVPSITVTTEDGRTITRKIEDKKNLEGVQVGDKIDITYTQALMVGAESAK
jgi:Cu/Ag efflux protein CusF